jgi:hypothetical protein
MDEIKAVADHIPTRARLDPELLESFDFNAKQMFDIQSSIMRTILDDATDVVESSITGQKFKELNLKKVEKFLKSHSDLLNKFPEIKTDLENAVSSEARFQQWSNRIAGLRKRLDDTSVLAQVLNVESVPNTIAGVLNGKTPVASFQELVALAKGGGPQGLLDLRAGLFEYVMARSGGEGGSLNVSKFLDMLNNPVQPGLPSLRTLMDEHAILGVDAAKVDDMLDIMEKLSVATGARAVGEKVLGVPELLTGVVIRGAGSVASTFVLRRLQQLVGLGKASTGPTLIVAQRGAQAAAEYLQRAPLKNTLLLMTHALSGAPIRPGGPPGGLFELLMARSPSVGQQRANLLQLHAYMWQAGLLGTVDGYEGHEALDQSIYGTRNQPPIAGEEFRRVEETAPDLGGFLEEVPTGPAQRRPGGRDLSAEQEGLRSPIATNALGEDIGNLSAEEESATGTAQGIGREDDEEIAITNNKDQAIAILERAADPSLTAEERSVMVEGLIAQLTTETADEGINTGLTGTPTKQDNEKFNKAFDKVRDLRKDAEAMMAEFNALRAEGLSNKELAPMIDALKQLIIDFFDAQADMDEVAAEPLRQKEDI